MSGWARNMASCCAWLVPLAASSGDRTNVALSTHALSGTGAGTLIGRREGCGIQLACPTISGEQCRIRCNKRQHRFELIDKSSNGTFVNGKLVGKDNTVPLAEGDNIQFTRRGNKDLQFRFTTFNPHCALGGYSNSSLEHVTSACAHAASHTNMAFQAGSATNVQTSLDAGDDADKLYKPGVSSDVCGFASRNSTVNSAGLQWARQQLMEEETLASNLCAEIAQARALLTDASFNSGRTSLNSLRPFAPAEGIRASEEAVQEAERTQLSAQRGVLETELAEQRAARDKLKRELVHAEVAVATERNERVSLADELRATIDGIERLAGQVDALQVFIGERHEEVKAKLHSLEPTQMLTVQLRKKLIAASAETQAAHATEQVLAKKMERHRKSIVCLQQLGQTLAQDLTSQASLLASCIEASSAAGQVCPQDSSSLQMQVDAPRKTNLPYHTRHLKTPPSRNQGDSGGAPPSIMFCEGPSIPTTQVQFRQPLAVVTEKENLAPAVVSAQEQSVATLTLPQSKRSHSQYMDRISHARSVADDVTTNWTDILQHQDGRARQAIPNRADPKRPRISLWQNITGNGPDYVSGTGRSAELAAIIVEDLCSPIDMSVD